MLLLANYVGKRAAWTDLEEASSSRILFNYITATAINVYAISPLISDSLADRKFSAASFGLGFTGSNCNCLTEQACKLNNRFISSCQKSEEASEPL